MTIEAAPSVPWRLFGGATCLDFVNTAHWRGGRVETEQLMDRRALLSWARTAKVLEPFEANSFPYLDLTRQQDGSVDPLLDAALVLRDSIHALFSCHADGRSPKADDLSALNTVLSWGPDQKHLVVSGGTVVWDAAMVGTSDQRLLFRIARSAADLLTGDRMDRVKQCASEECGWLFLDESRAGNRRWCSMETCGNRHKVRQHYRRHHQSQPPMVPEHAPTDWHVGYAHSD